MKKLFFLFVVVFLSSSLSSQSLLQSIEERGAAVVLFSGYYCDVDNPSLKGLMYEEVRDVMQQIGTEFVVWSNSDGALGISVASVLDLNVVVKIRSKIYESEMYTIEPGEFDKYFLCIDDVTFILFGSYDPKKRFDLSVQIFHDLQEVFPDMYFYTEVH